MSADSNAYYELLGVRDEADVFLATWHTGGPWTETHQHGGPPSALLTREIETTALPEGFAISRLTIDILGPIPVGQVEVAASVLRSGRAVHLAEAVLTDVDSGRAVAQARAWAVPDAPGPAVNDMAPTSTPDDGAAYPPPPGWVRGYIDSIDWRWVRGQVGVPGPGTVWMRPHLPLLEDEPLSPLQRVLTCVDSGSGISAELDIREWDFRNTDLTVHVVRPPEGEWLCVDAVTTAAGAGMGVCRATVSDARGIVAFSAQSLLIRPRTL
ncbi:MAG: thioesterase family protein [Austwickia sp.]|nr:thioesterase family protein [Austwickia sp.]